MRVSEMPQEERPGQRMRALGVHALTTAELLTIVLAVPKARAVADTLLLGAGGSLRRLATVPLSSLGTTAQSAERVGAALELGRRISVETREEGAACRTPRDVARYMAPKLEDCPVEEFHVLVLDAQRRMERDVVVSRGILTCSIVHPREVFREAIAERAASIILVHNHPSGDPTPSTDDRMVTEQLVAAGRLLDIPVYDHVIIGRGRYASFAEQGLL